MRDRMSDKLTGIFYEVSSQGSLWRVTGINYENGKVFDTLFSGDDSEQRALAYAKAMNLPVSGIRDSCKELFELQGVTLAKAQDVRGVATAYRGDMSETAYQTLQSAAVAIEAAIAIIDAKGF